jgi:hypothetical protein
MIIDSSDTWGLRQMVRCVQPDRFACRMGDRQLDSTDFRTGAHDSESIPNFRSRYHSECHSLSWPHSDHIRRTHGSDRRIVDRFPRSGPVTLNQGKNSRSWELSVPLLAAHPLCAVSAQRPPDLLFQLGLARHDRVKRSASISAGAMRRLLLTAVSLPRLRDEWWDSTGWCPLHEGGVGGAW